MPTLNSRMGSWDLDAVQEWSKRELVIRAPIEPIVHPDTVVATIGSCFAEELADMMGEVGVRGSMHPGGLFYSTATIRQELERIGGGWTERASEPAWATSKGLIDPFREYRTTYKDTPELLEAQAKADAAADATFRGAGVVVVTLGLIETWRSATTGNTFRQIPHPEVFPSLGARFHRLTVTEMLDDLDRIRAFIRDGLGAEMVVTTSPVPLARDLHGPRCSGRERRIEEPHPLGPCRSSSSATPTFTTSTRTRWLSRPNARAITTARTAGMSIGTPCDTSSRSSCACSPIRRCTCTTLTAPG